MLYVIYPLAATLIPKIYLHMLSVWSKEVYPVF